MKWILLLALLQCSCATTSKDTTSPAPTVATPASTAFEVIPLQFAAAQDVARQLKELGFENAGRDKSPSRIVADTRTNSMLVQAEAGDLRRIRDAIARIDVQVK